jgi:hypothetical protein
VQRTEGHQLSFLYIRGTKIGSYRRFASRSYLEAAALVTLLHCLGFYTDLPLCDPLETLRILF